MKILISGFLIFACWAAFSTWFYVCKINRLCNERETLQNSTTEVIDAYNADSVTFALTPKSALIPENLLIYFAYDKYEIVADSAISGYYDKSMAYMRLNPAAGIQITGHTDAKGSDEYNQTLGYRRAVSVRDYFISKGVPAEKITIGSKGESEPAENNNTEQGRAKNRRTSVSIK